MKRTAIVIAAATFAFSGSAAFADMEHEHGTMKMEHGGQMMHKSNVAHEEVVDGVKATFKVMDMREHMKAAKMEMPKGMKESHHLMVEFKDVKTGKAITVGEVNVKVQAPNKSEQTKDLTSMGGMAGMGGHFGGDFDMSAKGKYGIMAKFKLADGKVRSVKFWYEVK